MRNTIRRLALVPGALAAAGALALAGAATAGATVVTTGTASQAGQQAGGLNQSWRIRFVQTEMTVPENSCAAGNFQKGGVQLLGSTSNVAVGVICYNGGYYAGWLKGYTGTTFPHSLGHITNVAADDQILLQIYYNQQNNYDSVYAYDETSGEVLVNDAFRAGGAQYTEAMLGEGVSNPLNIQPSPGSSYIETPFADSTVTSYNGTHGVGLQGPWGGQNVQAVNGAHVIADAPLLYNSGTTFNVRIYGNS